MLEDFFAEITDSLPEPYLLLTQTGDIICTNLAARKKFSLTKNMTGNLNLNTLMEDDPAKHKQLLQMWSRSKSPLPGGLTRKNGDGTAVKYLCKGNTIRPAQNGESAIIFLHCTDKKQSTAVFLTLNEKVELLKREIAERRKAEQEILSLNEDLEQRVKRRTAELLQLNSELNNSIEELKSTQDQLVRTERLASLGSMVAVARIMGAKLTRLFSSTSMVSARPTTHPRLRIPLLRALLPRHSPSTDTMRTRSNPVVVSLASLMTRFIPRDIVSASFSMFLVAHTHTHNPSAKEKC